MQATSEAEKQYEAEAYSNIKLQSGLFEPGSRPGWLHFVCEGSQMCYIILPDWLVDTGPSDRKKLIQLPHWAHVV